MAWLVLITVLVVLGGVLWRLGRQSGTTDGGGFVGGSPVGDGGDACSGDGGGCSDGGGGGD